MVEEETRAGLIQRVTALDYWGGRGYGPARATAVRIVDQVIIPLLEATEADKGAEG